MTPSPGLGHLYEHVGQDFHFLNDSFCCVTLGLEIQDTHPPDGTQVSTAEPLGCCSWRMIRAWSPGQLSPHPSAGAFPSAFLRVSFTGCSLCQSGVVSPPESDTIFHGLFPPVLGVTRSLPHQPVDGGSAAPLLRSSIGWSDTCGCCCLCCGGLCTLWGHEPSAPVFLSLPASLPLPEGKVEWGGSRVPAGSCASFPEGTSLTEAVFWVHGRRTPD